MSIHENPAVSVAPDLGLVTFNQYEVVSREAGYGWSFCNAVVNISVEQSLMG